MSLSNLIRWGGLAVALGGALFVAGDLLGLTLDGSFAGYADTGTFVAQSALYLLGAALVLLGLVGLYARQAEDSGKLGLAGFLLAFLGTALLTGLMWTQAFVVPGLAAEAPVLLETEPLGSMLSFIAFTVGWLVFGVATLRARVYPRAAAILLIIGAMLPFAGFVLPASAFVFGIAVAWLGLSLWTREAAATGQTARSPA